MEQAKSTYYDIAIIGGGINGCGIAADASARGLKVALCERGDFGSETSGWSTKLIHGGLRYLEQYEWQLVRESLRERKILLQRAPHLVQPLPFILPHTAALRPAWVLRAGLWLYDLLSWGDGIPRSAQINLRRHSAGVSLQQHYRRGLRYYDCQTDDTRLVILNAIAARESGASMMNYTEITDCKRNKTNWDIRLQNKQTGVQTQIQCGCLINASGPWVSEVITNLMHLETKTELRLVQGSHIIVNQQWQAPHAFIFQNTDNRIVFAIPYLDKYTLIGTTDIEFSGDAHGLKISQEEIDYLLAAVNQYLQQPICKEMIIDSYSGVRALYGSSDNDASCISRDYKLELHTAEQQAPALSVFGGKLTTYRHLAERSLNLLSPHLPCMHACRSTETALPGGDLHGTKDISAFFLHMHQRHPWLPIHMLRRWCFSYGGRTTQLIGQATCLKDLGQQFAEDCYAAEIDYLIKFEMAHNAKDCLWRRSKLGYVVSKAQQLDIQAYIQQLSAKGTTL